MPNYPRVKVGPQLIEVVSTLHQARQPPLLIGETGVGKSESLRQASKALNVDYIEKDLSLCEPGDLLGLPYRDGNRTRFASPSWVPDGKRGGLMALEEINRCSRQVRANCLTLLSSRVLGDWRLPDNWTIVSSVNPEGDPDYDVDALDLALACRFVVIYVVPDVASWLAWARENDIHEAVQAYVRTTPGALSSGERGNPRSFSRLSGVLRAMEELPVSPRSMDAMVKGCVGPELGQGFLKLYRERRWNEVPAATTILTSYAKVRPKILQWCKEGRSDYIESLCHQLQIHMQDPEQETIVAGSERQMANLRQCIADMPSEWRRRLNESITLLQESEAVV